MHIYSNKLKIKDSFLQMMNSSSDSTINEIKLADGIYLTDYRKKPSNENSCQNYSLEKKNKLPQNPELLVLEFKESALKVEKLIYSIDEIKKVDDYLNDIDFVEAIQENYRVIPKMIDFNIQLLEELMLVDPKNEFLQKHDVKDLYEQSKKIIDEAKEFNKQFKQPEKIENIKPEEEVIEIKKEEQPDELYL